MLRCIVWQILLQNLIAWFQVASGRYNRANLVFWLPNKFLFPVFKFSYNDLSIHSDLPHTPTNLLSTLETSSGLLKKTHSMGYKICMLKELEFVKPNPCLLGHWYRKYKFFHSNPLFSSSPGFLTVLHLPSGDEKIFVDNPPLSYIKSCVLTCRLQIWTSFLVLPRQNIE